MEVERYMDDVQACHYWSDIFISIKGHAGLRERYEKTGEQFCGQDFWKCILCVKGA